MSGMKTTLLLCCALLAALPLTAQTAPGRPGPKSPAAKTEGGEQAEIPGTVITRPDGTFLGLTLEDGKYKLAFYDKEKKPMPVNVLRATARWPNLHGPGQNRTVLNRAGDGTYLLGSQFVRGPFAFRLFLTLITSETTDSAETYSLEFKG